MENNGYFIYVLLCGDGSFYGGYTTNVARRVYQHQTGKGAKYTKSHLPVKLIYSEEFTSKREALQSEYKFKHQSRRKKEQFLVARGVKKTFLSL
ncbi:endonuclease [Fructilactobacillus lindneri]|uniref:GIY-YIG domain-containing protein n=2 Tax=Fructilactobacillus lindneri TaxID=53444 RepID=A0A0R2JP20_9LACO|nr:GIY-YIG nuclease family protein [Fructilactobacillus lindneri]ANZ58093.1 endonuclease [Fructilactobacillus lindneri]ANZ59414.1 endonuclease [Fructilactobacillus lindneri]KRN78910.1 hypothetical protein IV52_GL000314 [Fructilactobacillus lindneri DSM 20690 = JCM 11027]POG98802.1 endonuclease [Fructilactobacillus lindneri]POH03075.1 endonuclease [Fructilactobacillus lindneri]